MTVFQKSFQNYRIFSDILERAYFKIYRSAFENVFLSTNFKRQCIFVIGRHNATLSAEIGYRLNICLLNDEYQKNQMFSHLSKSKFLSMSK